MVRLAAECGTTEIVATPHANLDFQYDPALVAERIARLAEAAGPLPRIHRGCDFHFFPGHVEEAIQEPGKYTIAGKRYLLIEFSDLLIFKETAEMLARLRAAGIDSILTHPERNWLLHSKVESLAEWVKDGLLLQATAQSFLGRFGPQVRAFAEELVRRGLVHVVASDAHDCEDRPPRLDLARQHVARRFGPEVAERLFAANPASILRGDDIATPPPVVLPRRKWRRLWRR